MIDAAVGSSAPGDRGHAVVRGNSRQGQEVPRTPRADLRPARGAHCPRCPRVPDLVVADDGPAAGQSQGFLPRSLSDPHGRPLSSCPPPEYCNRPRPFRPRRGPPPRDRRVKLNKSFFASKSARSWRILGQEAPASPGREIGYVSSADCAGKTGGRSIFDDMIDTGWQSPEGGPPLRWGVGRGRGSTRRPPHGFFSGDAFENR